MANWYPNHRTGPPRPLGDREIVGRRQRISKGVSWRDVQPEWCMMVLLAPTCTALALTVRHASPRPSRYAACARLSHDRRVAGAARFDGLSTSWTRGQILFAIDLPVTRDNYPLRASGYTPCFISRFSYNTSRHAHNRLHCTSRTTHDDKHMT